MNNYSDCSNATTLSVELIDGRLEVVKKQNIIECYLSHSHYPNPPIPKIWKEVYEASVTGVGGMFRGGPNDALEIILLKTIPAKYKPAQPESWSFEEEV